MLLLTDYEHTMAKSLILCGPNSNPNPKYLFIWDLDIKGSPYKGLVVCRNTWTSTKMGADKSAAIPTNAPKFVCPSPKVWNFYDKRLH